MARPNGSGGWDLTDDDVAGVRRASGWADDDVPGCAVPAGAVAAALAAAPEQHAGPGQWAPMLGEPAMRRILEAAAPLIAGAEREIGDDLVRAILVAVCERDGVSLDSSAEPGEPARNYELALRLGIGRVFGLAPGV